MENPSGATTETASTATADTSASPGAESPPAASTGEKQRIDELTGNWRETQRNLDHFRTRTEQLERENSELRGRSGKADESPGNDGDSANDADDEDIKTLADFKYDEKAYGKYIRDIARKESQREAEKVRSEFRGEKTAEQRRAAVDTFAETATTWAKEQKLDKVELLFASPAQGGPHVTDTMAEVIMSSEQGPAVLNYLARNQAESKRIAAMTPAQQGREIGRLEAKFAAAPTANTVSNAPPPHATVKGASDTTVTVDPAKQTDAEWWQSKQRSDRARAAARKR